MNYLKAAFASGLVAILLVIALSFISSGGRMYFSEVDWAKVNSMKYEDAQEYLLERSKSITRWESLKNGFSYSAFWVSAISDWILFFFVGFVSCITYQRLLQSNQSLKSGTPKSGAP